MACTFLLASAPPAPGPTRTITILQVLRRSSLLLAGVVALASRAGAQAVLPSATYVGEHWTVADGLPINTITALVQTRDGYLWLGTNDGVVRFDGVRFTVYNAGNTPEIPSNRIVSLHEDRAGALWILTEQQHLVRHLRGQFTHINAARGLKAGAVRLTEAADGTIVLATTRGVGIVQNGLFVPLVDTLSVEYGYGGAVKRRDGRVWLNARSHLWRIAKGRVEDVTPRAIRAPSVLRLALDSEDRLWLSDTSGIWVDDGGWRIVQRADGPVQDVDRFAFDARAVV